MFLLLYSRARRVIDTSMLYQGKGNEGLAVEKAGTGGNRYTTFVFSLIGHLTSAQGINQWGG